MISPSSETYLAALRLQFPCTNNVTEYESLVHGLLYTIQKGVKILHVYGDLEIVVKQVRTKYFFHNKRLSRYKNQVWDLIEIFYAFNIKSIYHSQNKVENSLAQSTSSLEPLEIDALKKFIVEITSTPLVLDNITNFQVFDDDKHKLDFLTNFDIFLT